MTLTGRVDHLSGTPALVDTYDQWTIVHRVDRAELGNTSRNYAFFAHGLVGNAGISTAAPNTVIEVTLADVDANGNVLTASVRETQRYQIADSRLWAAQAPRQMIPFDILLVLDPSIGSHPSWGTQWPANRDLAIVARLFANGDPGGGNGRCFLSDMYVVTWDLEALGGSRYYASEYRPGQPQAVNAAGAGFRYLTMTHGGGAIGATNELWLVFWGVEYRPSFVPGAAPTLRLFTSEDQIQGNEVDLDSTGMNGRLLGNINGRWNRYQQGGFRLLTIPATPPTFGVKGIDGYVAGVGNQAPGQTWVAASTVFAVRMKTAVGADDLHYVQTMQSAREQDVIDVVGSTLRKLEWEFPPPPDPTEYVVLARGHIEPGPAVGANQPHAYPKFLYGDNGTPEIWLSWGAEQLAEQGERVLSSWGRKLDGFGRGLANNLRFEFYWWMGVVTPIYATPETDVVNWTAVGFYFEDDPSNIPLIAVEPGSIVALIPGRESLDAGSLPALPRNPDARYVEEIDDRVADFLTDVGYRWRLPKGSVARRRFSLSFSGLTAAERDSDLAFYTANPWVKFTPRDEGAALACLVVTRPTAVPVGQRWNITVELLELVWVGV